VAADSDKKAASMTVAAVLNRFWAYVFIVDSEKRVTSVLKNWRVAAGRVVSIPIDRPYAYRARRFPENIDRESSVGGACQALWRRAWSAADHEVAVVDQFNVSVANRRSSPRLRGLRRSLRVRCSR
jgi:hypothetical protein